MDQVKFVEDNLKKFLHGLFFEYLDPFVATKT